MRWWILPVVLTLVSIIMIGLHYNSAHQEPNQLTGAIVVQPITIPITENTTNASFSENTVLSTNGSTKKTIKQNNEISTTKNTSSKINSTKKQIPEVEKINNSYDGTQDFTIQINDSQRQEIVKSATTNKIEGTLTRCGSFLSNEHVTFGYPSTEHILKRQAYVLSHNDIMKVPNWASYHLTKEYLKRSATRSNRFKVDPNISQGSKAELADYKGSNYHRGHLVPSADMLRSQSINDESFYLSNMAPQTESFNTGIWKQLENAVRDWAQKRESIWIITGPIFDTGYKTIGSNKVGVPQRFFKIIISGEDCDFDTIAFMLPNEKGEDLESHIVSIDEIEAATRLDFLDLLEDTLESKIESRPAKALWDEGINQLVQAKATSQPAIEEEAIEDKSVEYICSHNYYNCASFATHAQAQQVYEACGGPGTDIHDLDRDNDGRACESLP